MKKKRIGILTGGGDVQPLNAVLASAIETAKQNNIELLGFIQGWQGAIENNFISLNKKKINFEIGGTILKSSRLNLAKVEDGAKEVLDNLDKLAIEGLIVIGGEDTLSNALLLKEIPQVLISKTIDNDVGIINKNEIVNYFTLGHPTAAEKISSFVSLSEGLRTTAYSHERIIVVESMGMHAGWLALSSSMGNPDFVVVPEFPIDYKVLVEKVKERYLTNKNVIIVVAEGSKWSSEEYISADYGEIDSFGHPRFKGASNVLAEKLKMDLKKYFDTRNVNSINPSYLYRSGKPNKLDMTAALKMGVESIKFLKDKRNGVNLLTTSFEKNKLKVAQRDVSNLDSIDKIHRFVTEQFYNVNKLQVTKEGIKYLEKITPFIQSYKYGL
jgi:6-phosphofructokinase 1